MQKSILLLISCLSILPNIYATTFVPITHGDKTTGVSFSYHLRNETEKVSNIFMSTETINFHFNIHVKDQDIGQSAHLYLVAHYQDKWYQRTTTGRWKAWDNQAISLSPFNTKLLEKQEKIRVLDNKTLPEGEYLVYGGYQTEQDQQIFYNHSPVSMLVFNANNAKLHPIKNSSVLANYLAHGSANNNTPLIDLATVDNSINTISTQSENVADSGLVSQTNLQERGVDEADRIKTDGEHLYVLENCQENENQPCLSAYAIQAFPANNTQLQQLKIGENAPSQGGIYLATINDKKHIIYHTDSFNYGLYDSWYLPYRWQNTATTIKIIDVSQPHDMSIKTHITLDTAILSTRLIDGVLYLITRKNAYFPLENQLLETHTINGDVQPRDNPIVTNNQTANDLLPTISFNDGVDPVTVVKATDCYIPHQTSDKSIDNTIITLTAIPLNKPKAYYSTCIAGAVDTFYMSTNALYLATNRNSYTVSENNIIFSATNNVSSTEIHKFSLAKNSLAYRGSGTVPGHLGWDADKQPFRFGEYDGLLKVATSIGNTWGNDSKTRVSVLREATNSNDLEEISFIDNLGKVGERLFAARFIKNRGYLVTFKQTDPLYVLDFTDPEQPTVLGALEINGYSDYLQPIGDNYLLGIGKDAIPNDNPAFGALYQGVKLSLFDVSTKENLREIESVILGKRGSESAVLSDHHALAWLASKQDNVATLAIPVQLNTEQNSNQDNSDPNAFYDWTHTGLYTFKITTGANPSITLQGKLIADSHESELCKEALGHYCNLSGISTHNDRVVIQEDSIHYIHNNSVLSSTIANLAKVL
jgi:uncharacterized secreted protein with C-terminal beta-propeller domain